MATNVKVNINVSDNGTTKKAAPPPAEDEDEGPSFTEITII
jgi:hypothetical protein